MTDTITPASLRAHAGHFAGRWPLVCEALNDEAARLEAESAHENHLLELAKEFWCGMGGEYDDPDPEYVAQAWEDMTPEWKRRYANGVRAVLAADGRLLPEGGTAVVLADAWDRGWNDCSHWWHDGEVRGEEPGNPYLDTPPAVSVPDSGPDGTPEKPWPTWQDVPEGVNYHSAYSLGPAYVNHHDEPFVILGGIATRVAQWCAMESAAPFVRVDGDKA
ncbi:hypothetical protein GS921_00375 [Rhodococcus hoagii]|nr:hypothetical protein [Prescottella equi]NKV28234.1 hypothetical protein [Prescottella equi]